VRLTSVRLGGLHERGEIIPCSPILLPASATVSRRRLRSPWASEREAFRSSSPPSTTSIEFSGRSRPRTPVYSKADYNPFHVKRGAQFRVNATARSTRWVISGAFVLARPRPVPERRVFRPDPPLNGNRTRAPMWGPGEVGDPWTVPGSQVQVAGNP